MVQTSILVNLHIINKECVIIHGKLLQTYMRGANLRVILRFKSFILLTFLIITSASFVVAQDPKVKAESPEAIAESVVIIYSGLRGRDGLNQIRKTTVELGTLKVNNPDGTTDKAKYERYVVRGDNLYKERNRLEQDFPSSKFAIIYDGEKTFGLLNSTVFAPRDEVARDFHNQIWHGIDALLRYKENESKIELVKKDKLLGVDYYVLDLTDKQDRKTRYYISQKYLHVKMLEYEENGVKYRRKFYDYNYAQGTLVPYRTVLWADDKIVEETEISTITFGQKIEDDMFQGS